MAHVDRWGDYRKNGISFRLWQPWSIIQGIENLCMAQTKDFCVRQHSAEAHTSDVVQIRGHAGWY